MRTILLAFVIFSASSALAKLHPWPVDNQGNPRPQTQNPQVSTPDAPATATGNAAPAGQLKANLYGEAKKNQDRLPKDESAQGQQNPFGSVMEQISGLAGGGGELANPGGSGGGYDFNNPSSSLDFHNENTPGLANDAETININGCTNTKGRFQTSYVGDEGATIPNGKCDRGLNVTKDFAEFMNNNLSRCVQAGSRAVGRDSGTEGLKIYHAGTVPDENHSSSSLHAKGRAIDIKAIAVGNNLYSHADQADSKFFDAFRTCWGKTITAELGGCKTTTYPGTIGHEDSAHHNHIHVSFPVCADQARKWGWKRAHWFHLLPPAMAESPKDDDHPDSTFETKTVPVKNGVATITIKNTHGEPVSGDRFISITVKCKAFEKTVELAKDVQACAYEMEKYDAKAGVLTLHHRTSKLMNNGRVSCRVQQRPKYEIKCP